jgi:hypothetical protein
VFDARRPLMTGATAAAALAPVLGSDRPDAVGDGSAILTNGLTASKPTPRARVRTSASAYAAGAPGGCRASCLPRCLDLSTDAATSARHATPPGDRGTSLTHHDRR